jgi:hypothetical protein
MSKRMIDRNSGLREKDGERNGKRERYDVRSFFSCSAVFLYSFTARTF